MIKKLKMYFNKILIACLTLISSIAIFSSINKTYAYSTDNFSYTIDTNNLNFTTINNKNGVILTYNNSQTFNMLNNVNIETNDYILVNFLCLNANNEIVNFGDSISYTMAVGGRANYFNFIINNTEYVNNGIYTNINKLNIYNSVATNCTLTITINYNIKIFILNIDIVKPYDIGLSQYYQTYYGQIEDNYNQLQQDYNDLQDNYDTLQTNYDTLEDNYNNLQTDYNTLEQQKTQLESQITTLQNQKTALQQQLQQVQSEYNNIINITAPFNPNNIESTSVLFNNNNIDIPYDSFINFEYYQIELALEYFDLLETYNPNPTNNILSITINLKQEINFDTLEYWCHMRNSYSDTLNIYFIKNGTTINSQIGMNNEHTDNGNPAAYYLTIDQPINRIVFEFSLHEEFYEHYSGEYDYLIQYGTYSQGYQEGLIASNTYIQLLKTQYENTIEELEQQINNLNISLSTITDQYTELLERYNTITSGNNDLYSMIIAVADTPLRIFTQIFNFDILGINISGFILSIVSLLVIIWLIKKII